MINDYPTLSITYWSYNELYQMYLNRQFEDVEQVVRDSKIPELKQFARNNYITWYQGSKVSFLEQLRINFAHRKVVVGDEFK